MMAELTPAQRKIVYHELCEEEGVRLKAYRDTKGKLTIGVGHNCEANPTAPIIGRPITRVGQSITEAESVKLFEHDLSNVMHALDHHLDWWTTVAPFARRYVMISLCFNLGINGLLEFTHTLGSIKSGKYADAATHLKDSLWCRQVGNRCPKLCRILSTGEVRVG